MHLTINMFSTTMLHIRRVTYLYFRLHINLPLSLINLKRKYIKLSDKITFKKLDWHQFKKDECII